ncbi:MAG TPA: type VI secretion system tube protein Hcp [Aliidongia sp.]|nr:type VI secretion system tube protein Hcp [Aliidongia sp.]
MAFDAYLYFSEKGNGGKSSLQPQGESLIAKGAITLAESWGFGVENKLNIKATTQGGGSGKAEFQEFKVKKAVDAASPHLYLSLCQGVVYNHVYLVLQKSTGGQSGTQSTAPYLIWEFIGFMIEKIDWSHADDEPEEEVTFKFGACQISYSQQAETGALKAAAPAAWDQLTNSNSPNPPFKQFTQPAAGTATV